MNKSILIISLIILAGCSVSAGKYDDFAKCLTANDAKMYGAFWCPHCQNQKKSFGSSWQYVNYVECSLPDGRTQTEFCKAQNIEGYPTWEFKDGSRLDGEVAFDVLAEKSGCPLPQ